MATFFNQKQDVIDIELTKYGEYLLSLGKFDPTYYAFYDTEILYDTRYTSFSSSQNDLETRIQSETPSVKTLSSFEGRGEQVLEYNRIIQDNPRLREDQKIRFQSTADRNYTPFRQALGNSELSADKTPAWKMLFYHNKMDHIDLNLTGSRDTQKIPQITSTIEYETQIRSKSILPDGADPDLYQPNDSDPVLQDQIYQDGSFVEVKPDYILLELQEKNAPFLRENFYIEVYEIKDETLQNGDTVENWIPMKFRKKRVEIENNLLVDSVDQSYLPLDPSFVEYYFDVFVDDEVDEVVVCKSINKLRSRGIYVETDYECPDLMPIVSKVDPYSTLDIENPSDECAVDIGTGEAKS